VKTIGLIGGMSWESTVTYYQVINETIKQKLGGFHSAKILMYSVDFDEIETNMKSGDWSKNAAILSDAAKRLETAGADFILICTNTLHKVAPEVSKQLSVPILHIAEMTARELKKAGIDSVGLLGTRYTMTEKFYTDILEQNGIRVLIPEEEEAQFTDRIIFDELCIGDISDSSRQKLIGIMECLRKKGAQGIVLGCTELGLLISPENTDIPLFDTTLIHARAAALASLEK
jgi:aspartate racemase